MRIEERKKNGFSLHDKRLLLEVEIKELSSRDKQSRPEVNNFYAPCWTKQKMSEAPQSDVTLAVYV